MKVSHAWLQTFFDDPIPAAKECADLFTFHSFEVEGVESTNTDSVLDIDVLPNRSSDCLSHRGIARELSTILDRPMKRDPLADPLPSVEAPERFTVSVDDPALCPRYIGAVLRGVTVRESPAWLKTALERVGQRSINNIVDATNYVMLELGQPLHAFDRAKLADNDEGASVRVRMAVDGEAIPLLGGEERTLTGAMLLIVDGVSDAPLAVAGVKGGTVAEITNDTRDIVLESANFNPISVRRTAQALKLSTDASVRFQNEPAPELAAFAMRDVITLIRKVAGGELAGVYDTNPVAHERTPVIVPLTRINGLLGTSLSVHDVESILVRFGWEFSCNRDTFVITPPWERTDLSIPAAVIEEIGRIYGLRTITAQAPQTLARPAALSRSHYYGDRIRTFLTGMGYSEVLTYVLQPHGVVELANPLATDKAFMRATLRDGVEQALAYNATNAPLLGLDDVRIFELGTRFTKHGEELALAVGVKGVTTKQSALEQVLRGDIARLEEDLGVSCEGSAERGIYEMSLTQMLAELPTPHTYAEALPWNNSVRFAPWSQYPFVLRDIAVWVPAGVPAEEVLAVLLATAPDLLVRHDQFDTFEKNGRVSYAWHLVYQAYDRTLTDSEVSAIMENITTAITRRSGWEVR